MAHIRRVPEKAGGAVGLIDQTLTKVPAPEVTH